MLVVIAVIAALAAMIFPAANRIKIYTTKQKAQTELKLIASAITDYKHQYGHYPATIRAIRSLMGSIFELLGTTC